MNIRGGMKDNMTMLGVYDVGRKTRVTNLVVVYHSLEVRASIIEDSKPDYRMNKHTCT